ncbi:hypothetical protein V1477_019207, partial [Vespula maculifrons]
PELVWWVECYANSLRPRTRGLEYNRALCADRVGDGVVDGDGVVMVMVVVAAEGVSINVSAVEKSNGDDDADDDNDDNDDDGSAGSGGNDGYGDGDITNLILQPRTAMWSRNKKRSSYTIPTANR